MFMWKSNKRLLDTIDSYLKLVQIILEDMCSGIDHYCENGIDAHFISICNKIDEFETQADELRSNIEYALYKKSLLPESREDILLLLERLDLIPNQTEELMRMIRIQNLILPKIILPELIELSKISYDCFFEVKKAVNSTFYQKDDLKETIRKIVGIESMADKLEQQIITKIFQTEEPTADKILYRDIIMSISKLSDYGEDVAYFLTIFNIKRKI